MRLTSPCNMYLYTVASFPGSQQATESWVGPGNKAIYTTGVPEKMNLCVCVHAWPDFMFCNCWYMSCRVNWLPVKSK